MKPSFLVAVLLPSLLLATLARESRQNVRVPYDNANPILYDNDDHRDAYVGEYLMVLTSAGDIDLQGTIMGSLWPGGNRDNLPTAHRQVILLARRSGLRNIPDPVPGAFASLQRPPSGNIEHTSPVDTPGARLIVTAARATTPAKPLLMLTGGQPTNVASAYLLDHSISKRLVVA